MNTTHDIGVDSAGQLGSASQVIRSNTRRPTSAVVSLGIQAASLLLDALVVFVVFWAAYELRYTHRIGAFVPSAQDTLGFEQWSRHALLAMLLTSVVFFARGVYQVDRRRTAGEYIPLIASSFLIVIAGVILIAFFVQFSPSRAIYAYALVMGISLMLAHRLAINALRNRLFRRGVGVDRAVIVGESESARRLSQALLGQSRWGYQLVGLLGSSAAAQQVSVATGSGIQHTSNLGDISRLGRVLEDLEIDDAFIVETDYAGASVEEIIEVCRLNDVRFWMVPDLLQISIDRAHVTDINGIPLLGISDASIKGWDAFIKRALDLAVSTVLLVAMAIPFLFVAAMIRLDSPGRIFYKQKRTGRHATTFEMVKFRTMVPNADALREKVVSGAEGDLRLFKDSNDPRITRVGSFLRKFSIDELPQIWNVFRGDMTLVGPRPPLPSEVAMYEPWHHQRLLVRPGMTGLWQVSGRSDLTFDQMVRLDLYYAENWSLWLDIRILLRTIPAVIFRRGAY